MLSPGAEREIVKSQRSIAKELNRIADSLEDLVKLEKKKDSGILVYTTNEETNIKEEHNNEGVH